MEWTQQGQFKLTAAKKLHNDAMDQIASRQFDKALHSAEESYRLRRQVLQGNHPIMIMTLDLKATIFQLTGQRRELYHILKEIYHFQLERYGLCNQETESTMERLWVLASELGEKAEADQIAGDIWKARTLTPAERENMDLKTLLEKRFQLPDALKKRLETSALAHTSVLSVSEENVVERRSKYAEEDFDPKWEFEKAKAKRQGITLPETRPKPQQQVAVPAPPLDPSLSSYSVAFQQPQDATTPNGLRSGTVASTNDGVGGGGGWSSSPNSSVLDSSNKVDDGGGVISSGSNSRRGSTSLGGVGGVRLSGGGDDDSTKKNNGVVVGATNTNKSNTNTVASAAEDAADALWREQSASPRKGSK